MTTIPMPCTDQELPQADNHKDEPSREETQDMTTQGIDSSLLETLLNDCRVEMVGSVPQLL